MKPIVFVCMGAQALAHGATDWRFLPSSRGVDAVVGGAQTVLSATKVRIEMMSEPADDSAYESRLAAIRKMKALREKAIQAGMEIWDRDRILEEIEQRRGERGA